MYEPGECITKLRLVLHHPSVLLQLGDLSANQMRGTQDKAVDRTGLDCLRRLVAQLHARQFRRWWG